jgi:CRISPR-associated protein Cas4
MNNYIIISALNSFTFCPYSIYLHNIFADSDDDIYYAQPQIKGRIAHEAVDSKRASSLKNEIQSLPVSSDELCIMGKIDVYRKEEKMLIERKYKLKQIYRGYLYQIWAQYFCMLEMGYDIEKLAFYEIQTNKMFPIDIPTDNEKQELINIIKKFRNYNLEDDFVINDNKCRHCIYCNLCDKTSVENVYS